MPTRMPKRAVKQEDYEDDFESGEEPETLIAKPLSKTKSGSKRQSRKSNRGSASNSTKHRAHSAPGSKSARDLWMNTVKTRSTSKLANGRPPESPRRKTPVEYWVDTLRKSRSGISTESTGMNTFSGMKKTDSKNMPYLSTPAYLRQVAGTERASRREYDPTVRAAPGTPAYKSPEEYYDDIIDLKKHVVALNHEVSTLRAKLRRTEENNIKKDKDIGQLLDPSKSEDLRRTLGDRKPESGAVIQSLKQKILKLETQLKDKETSYTKLQSDLKATKLEEMKTQMDVLYQEIVRLQNTKEGGTEKLRPSKENNVKVKALNETILRLNETNQRWMSENKTLKEDLQKALDDAAPAKSHRIREFEDMNKRELLTTLYGMKKKLDRAERNRDRADGDTTSQLSLDSYRSGRPVSGKIKLEGTPEERLTQLDNRETELLEEIEKLKAIIKRLREDRSRTKSDGRNLTQRSPRPESSRSRHGGNTPRDRITTPRDRITTPRDRAPSPATRKSRSSESARGSSRGDDDQQRKVSRFREDHAAKSIQREWRAHRNRQDQDEARQFEWRMKHFLENRAATVIQREWRNHQQRDFDGKVQNFTQNRAARRIQNQWHGYQDRRDQNDATESIQAALRGHSARKQQMSRYRDYDDGSSTLTDDSYDDAVNTIQSSLRGHKARRERLRNTRLDSTEDEDDLMSRRRSLRPQSGKSSTSSSALRHNELSSTRSTIFSARRSPTYDDEDDDDIVVG